MVELRIVATNNQMFMLLVLYSALSILLQMALYETNIIVIVIIVVY